MTANTPAHNIDPQPIGETFATNTPANREDLATGTLLYGVLYEGKRHYDFSVRIPTMGDNVEALETLPGAHSARVEVAMYTTCLERLGDIPPDEISLGLVLGIYPSDIDIIAEAITKAKKKYLKPKPS